MQSEDHETLTREMIEDGIADPAPRTSIVKPYVMSHGTLECYRLAESRKFYEEFLGLECVRHGKPSMVIRLGLKFNVVCVEVGDEVRPQGVLNHWGLDLQSEEEVKEAHANALKYKDKYGIRQVMEPVHQHGVFSFYMEDLDHNWWELQASSFFRHDDTWDFGDRFDENGEPL